MKSTRLPPSPEILEAVDEYVPRWLVKQVTTHERDPLSFTKWQLIVVLRWPAYVGFGAVHMYYQHVLQDALGSTVSVWVW